MSSKVFDWLKTDCQTERENKNCGFFSVKHKIFETDFPDFLLPSCGAYLVNNEYWSVFVFVLFSTITMYCTYWKSIPVRTVHDWPQEKKNYQIF